MLDWQHGTTAPTASQPCSVRTPACRSGGVLRQLPGHPWLQRLPVVQLHRRQVNSPPCSSAVPVTAAGFHWCSEPTPLLLLPCTALPVATIISRRVGTTTMLIGRASIGCLATAGCWATPTRARGSPVLSSHPHLLAAGALQSSHQPACRSMLLQFVAANELCVTGYWYLLCWAADRQPGTPWASGIVLSK